MTEKPSSDDEQPADTESFEEEAEAVSSGGEGAAGADVADIMAAFSAMMHTGARTGVLWAAMLIYIAAALVSLIPWGLLFIEVLPPLSMATTAMFLGAELIAALVTFLAFALTRSFRAIYLEDTPPVAGVGDALSDAVSKYIDVASFSIAIGFLTLMFALLSWFVGLGRNAGFFAGALLWIVLSPGLYLLAVDEFTLDEGLNQGWAIFKRRWVDLIWAYAIIGVAGFVVFGGTYYALSSLVNMFVNPMNLTGRLAGVLVTRTLIGSVAGVVGTVMFVAIFVRLELSERAEDQPPEVWEQVGPEREDS